MKIAFIFVPSHFSEKEVLINSNWRHDLLYRDNTRILITDNFDEMAGRFPFDSAGHSGSNPVSKFNIQAMDYGNWVD